MSYTPYLSYGKYLEDRYGYRIYRVGVDAGFSCPHRDSNRHGGCVFCDEKGSSAAYQRTDESLAAITGTAGDVRTSIERTDICSQIVRGRDFLKRRYNAEHFALYLQAFSNTFAPVCRLRSVYDEALGSWAWEQFIVSTRPDCLGYDVLDLLDGYRGRVPEVCLELGLQSGDDSILKAMNRGHDVRCLTDACSRASEYGFELCLHIMLGFPGEGVDEIKKTADVINAVHPNAIKIHNLNVVEGTVLADMYRNNRFCVPDAAEHIKRTVYLLRRIYPDIVIERLLCETPSHRLIAPADFPDKNTFLNMLKNTMIEMEARQGDLL